MNWSSQNEHLFNYSADILNLFSMLKVKIIGLYHIILFLCVWKYSSAADYNGMEYELNTG